MTTPLVLRRYRMVDGWQPGAVRVHDERNTGWAIEVVPTQQERRERRMTHKILDMQSRREITPQMESAMKRAYEEFTDESDLEIRAPKREHLGRESRPGACCQHKWVSAPSTKEVLDLFHLAFEEQDLGAGPVYCMACGAIALFDKMPDRMGVEVPTLWAYDATAGLGQIKKERDRGGRQKRRKR